MRVDDRITVIIGDKSYDVEISDGVIKSDFEEPELLLILPNILHLPQKTKNPIRVEGKHTFTDYALDYRICGTRMCTLAGYKEIENKVGDLNCTNITCNTQKLLLQNLVKKL
jgi:hypothetical protein